MNGVGGWDISRVAKPSSCIVLQSLRTQGDTQGIRCKAGEKNLEDGAEDDDAPPLVE